MQADESSDLIRGEQGGPGCLLGHCLLLVWSPVLVLGLIALDARHGPEVRGLASGLLGLVPAPVVGMWLALVGWFVVHLLRDRRALARRGVVRLGPRRVALVKGGAPILLRPEDLAGYDARRADCVQLHPRGVRRPGPRLAIPTLTEADRTRVLAWLDARQVTRLG